MYLMNMSVMIRLSEHVAESLKTALIEDGWII